MAYFGSKEVKKKFPAYDKEGDRIGYYALVFDSYSSWTEHPEENLVKGNWQFGFINESYKYNEEDKTKLKLHCTFNISLTDSDGYNYTLKATDRLIKAYYQDDGYVIEETDNKWHDADIDGTIWAEYSIELEDEFGNSYSGNYVVEEGYFRNYNLTFTEAPSFNETQNEITVFFKRREIPKDYREKIKVLGAEIGIALQNSDTMLVPFRAIPHNIETGSYTFIFTEEEKQALIDGVTKGTSANIRYVLKTKGSVGNDYGYNFSNRVFSLVGAEPILDPIVEDGNTVTAALTGDIHTMVKYHSTAVYAINAAASKGATIVYQEASCGNKKNTSPYGQLDNVESGNFLFTVVDSRETIAYKTIEKNFINYIKPTCNVTKVDADATKIVFEVSGNFFNDTFGAVHNEVSITYRCKIGDAEYGAPAQVPVADISTNGNTYRAQVTLTNIDYRNRYIVEATVTDKLESATNSMNVTIFPIFDWSEEDFNFNIPVTYSTKDGNVYSITDNIQKLDGLEITYIPMIPKLINAMTRRYELDVTVTPLGEFTTAECSMFLYGNTIRGHINVHRRRDIEIGNIDNENVCKITFDSGGKVTGFGAVSFNSGGTGGLANFNMKDTLIYADDGSVDESQVGLGTFTVEVTATDVEERDWSGYFVMPCLIDLSKY